MKQPAQLYARAVLHMDTKAAHYNRRMLSQQAQRVGYFGGSFDPPHLGHLAVARAAADRFALDRVLLVPTGRQPLKPEGAVASFGDRLAMVQLLCQADQRLHASYLEAPVQTGGGFTPNYTVDTLDRLRDEESGAELFVIVGADAFHQLPQWRSPERLLTLAEWIVVTRPRHAADAVELPPLTDEQRQRVHLLSDVDEPASATAVRLALTRHEDCAGLLAPEVLAYIREHHLYR
jgi:nicotinate-nucleotide adenylyltransferase